VGTNATMSQDQSTLFGLSNRRRRRRRRLIVSKHEIEGRHKAGVGFRPVRAAAWIHLVEALDRWRIEVLRQKEQPWFFEVLIQRAYLMH
jgi:hypothetical protein